MMAMMPVAVMPVTMPPMAMTPVPAMIAHLGRQLAGATLRGRRGDARIERCGCLRMLGRSRDEQKRADCGQAEYFLHLHVVSPWGRTNP